MPSIAKRLIDARFQANKLGLEKLYIPTFLLFPFTPKPTNQIYLSKIILKDELKGINILLLVDQRFRTDLDQDVWSMNKMLICR